MKTCPNCSSEYGYPMSDFLYACPECGHEWNPDTEEKEAEANSVIKDANGNPLQDGDTVIIVKDLPVKGAPKPFIMFFSRKSLFLSCCNYLSVFN